MLRRLLLAAAIALVPSLASAQFAAIGNTPPTSDNGDRLATTAWVNQFAAGSIPLQSGKMLIGSVGNLAVGQTPSGDLTVSNAGVFTFNTVNPNVGVFGSVTQCLSLAINGKGLITAAVQAVCTPAIGSITGLGTGVGTALGLNVGSAGAPVLFNGAGGLPTSITLTNGAGLPTTGLTGTLQAAQEPAHTGDVTNSAGSLALAYTTVVPASKGGAGTITGALRGNGSGTVTQAACADLSNAAAGCAAAAAAKSDEQAGSSATLMTTPSQQQQHDSAAKAWVSFNGNSASCPATVCAILAGYNVSGVTRASAGTYTVSFTVPFASANYACSFSSINTTILITGKSAGGANLSSVTFAGASTDTSPLDLICFGRQ